MKIVINVCYGGFNLSHAGVMYYAKVKGIKLYAYVLKWEDDLFSGKEYDRNDGAVIPYEKRKSRDRSVTIYYATKGGLKTEEEMHECIWYPGEIRRDDPALVKTVEDLGEKASGSYSKLKVVEIPDDVEWRIFECGGSEWVVDKNRVWR